MKRRTVFLPTLFTIEGLMLSTESAEEPKRGLGKKPILVAGTNNALFTGSEREARHSAQAPRLSQCRSRWSTSLNRYPGSTWPGRHSTTEDS